MIDFMRLWVGDEVQVEYTTGTWSKGGRLHGIITKIWTPAEHRAGQWQAEVNHGWCFHEHDLLVAHRKPKFQNVFCSQCGQEFGPRDSGYSHCLDHQRMREGKP